MTSQTPEHNHELTENRSDKSNNNLFHKPEHRSNFFSRFKLEKHSIKNKIEKLNTWCSLKCPLFPHLLKYQTIYLLIFAFLVLLIPLAINFATDKPLLMGMESYYHLSNAKQITSYNFYYAPLNLLFNILPEELLALIPVIFGLLTIYLLITLLKKLSFSDLQIFIFSLLLITLPAFIFNFITLSNISLFVLLILICLNLGLSSNLKVRRFAFLPLIFTIFFDLVSSILALAFMLVWLNHFTKKEERSWGYLLAGILSVLSLSNFLFLNVPLISPNFNSSSFLVNLLSDLGSVGGLSLFVSLLALLGMNLLWKDRNYRFLGVFLLLALIASFFSYSYVLLVGILSLFFAIHTLMNLFQKEWKLPLLKSFTVLIILLGIFFSITSYALRVNTFGPSAEEYQTLTWIKENLPSDLKVLSTPENSYYLSYLGDKQPLVYYHEVYSLFPTKIAENEQLRQMFTSAYTSTTFPLLEQNKIELIYISPSDIKTLPSESSLLSVLKNERFKMVHSSGEAEAWSFN